MEREALVKARGGMSQVEAAKMIGINQRHLSRLETGNRKPSADVMAKISNHYGISPEELFKDIFLTEITP